MSGGVQAFQHHPATPWPGGPLDDPVALAAVPAGKQVFIEVRDLHKRFGNRHILRGIDLNIYRGETLVILGTSGSGKTTFFKHLIGSHSIDQGTLTVNGENVATFNTADWERYRNNLGVVFQLAALLGSLTVFENVGLPLLECDRLPADQVRKRVIRALQRVFLPAEEILELKPAELSGGMRKRVGLARAIIREPSLLLYDEPTTGLDPVTVSGVNDLTLELQKSLGVTSVVITHDLAAAFTIADRIAVLYKGRIIACDTPNGIQSNNHPVVAQLLTGSTEGPLTEALVRGHRVTEVSAT